MTIESIEKFLASPVDADHMMHFELNKQTDFLGGYLTKEEKENVLDNWWAAKGNYANIADANTFIFDEWDKRKK